MGKLMKTMLASLMMLLLLGGGALITFLYVNNDQNSGDEQSIDEVLKYSYETPEITTDLQDNSFVRIQFQVITDSEEAKEEVEKREFQLKNILIKELSKMEEEKFKTGISDLEDVVQQRLNEVMAEGRITDVYTISKILQ